MLILFPSGHNDPGWCHIPGAGLAWIPRLECVGLRELGTCGRQCASTMNLEYLLPSRYRRDNLRNWNEQSLKYICVYICIYIHVYIRMCVYIYIYIK